MRLLAGIVACPAGTMLPSRFTYNAFCFLWSRSNGILTGTREMMWLSGGSSRYRRRTKVCGCRRLSVRVVVVVRVRLLSDTACLLLQC